MRCVACGNEMGERNICQVCGTPRKNVLCNNNIVSVDNGTEVMYEHLRQSPPKKEAVFCLVEENTETAIEEDFSVISDCNDEDNKTHKTDKKKSHRILLFIILGIIITISVVIVFLLLRKEKAYQDSLPSYKLTFYDTENDIMYDSNQNILFYGLNTCTDISVTKDSSKMLFLEEGKLYSRSETGDTIIDEQVSSYIGNDSYNVLLYSKTDENGIRVILKKDGSALTVKDSLLNIDNMVVSENGKYFAFRTSWTYEEWVKDYQLPEGGSFVTRTVYELYSVSAEGDEKLRIQTEDEVKNLYITNQGELIYSDMTEETMMLETNGSESSVCSAADRIIYNEQLDSAIIVSTKGDLIYWSKTNNELFVVSTDIDQLYYINSHKGYCDFYPANNTVSNQSDIDCVVYTKGDRIYYNNFRDLTDSILIFCGNFDASKIQMIDETSFFYVEDNTYLYELKDGQWNKKESELYYYNKCGKGFATLENENIMYTKKKKAKEICVGDEILVLAGNWIYYRLGNSIYRINIDGKSEPELLFDKKVSVQVIYE